MPQIIGPTVGHTHEQPHPGELPEHRTPTTIRPARPHNAFFERLIPFLGKASVRGRYESLEEGVVRERAGRIVMGVRALIVRHGQVAHWYARLQGQYLGISWHARSA